MEDFSPSLPNSSQLPDTNTTASDAPQPSPEAQHTSLPAFGTPETEIPHAFESATEEVISSALEDTAGTSTVPPVIEAQESDLRDTSSHLALPTEPQLEALQTLEVNPQVELPIHNMDGAVRNPDALNVALDDGTTEATSLPSADAPPPADALPPTNALSSDDLPVINNDVEMPDAPELVPFAKVSREREDHDDDDEPSAKRTKTEDDIPAQETQSVPEAPAALKTPPADAQNGEPAVVKSNNTTTITDYEAKEIIKILKNVVRTNNGKNFRGPVTTLWPGLAETYNARVSHPVDIATMETNLREHKYPTMDAFKSEVNLIHENALTYNGDAHEVTVSAKAVRDAILKKMETIPPEPAHVPKAVKKQRKSTPVAEPAPRTSAPRRQSKSTGAAPATFALDPNTSTPLIRRDSTKLEGGRPKREIHPPKKDLPYSSTSRPKNKKAALEIKFCEEVLIELKKPKHASFANPFMVPVDPVSLNIPSYFNVIKHPMDISKVEEKMKSGEISSAKDFERDMRLMFSNCYKFNPASNMVHQLGKQLEVVFNETWATKSKWFADHAPAAETSSTNGDSDDVESEEEVEVEDSATTNAITVLSERLNEEQEKLIALLSNPKKNAQMIEMQNEMINMLKAKLTGLKAKLSTTKKVVKKPRAAKPAKKQAPAKKSGPAAAKKSGGRTKYLGTHEKNIISIGITRLPDDIVKDILAMIKSETDVDVSDYHCSNPAIRLTSSQEGDDGEVELDIDVVSQQSLWKIYNHVLRYAPEAVDEARAMLDDKEEEAPTKSAKPPAKKKNKPMSKNEQERKIEQLEGALQTFQRHTSGSQEPMPSM